jgi:hypothetical protein
MGSLRVALQAEGMPVLFVIATWNAAGWAYIIHAFGAARESLILRTPNAAAIADGGKHDHAHMRLPVEKRFIV